MSTNASIAQQKRRDQIEICGYIITEMYFGVAEKYGLIRGFRETVVMHPASFTNAEKDDGMKKTNGVWCWTSM